MTANTAIDLLSLGYWIALVLFLYFSSKARAQRQRRFLAPTMAILSTCMGIARSAARFAWQDASLSYFLGSSFVFLLMLSLIFYFHTWAPSDKKSPS